MSPVLFVKFDSWRECIFNHLQIPSVDVLYIQASIHTWNLTLKSESDIYCRSTAGSFSSEDAHLLNSNRSFSKMRMGPVELRMMRGWPLKRQKTVPARAVPRKLSITPCWKREVGVRERRLYYSETGKENSSCCGMRFLARIDGKRKRSWTVVVLWCWWHQQHKLQMRRGEERNDKKQYWWV